MRTMRNAWAATAVLLAVSTPALAQDVVINTTNGPVTGRSYTVAGTASTTYRYFGSIPFAAPPVGALRWKAPQPAATWTTPRPALAPDDATNWKLCVQMPTELRPLLAGAPPPGSEDCLYLNVFTPGNTTASSNLPVMVWVHGGAFFIGSGATYDGSALAAKTNSIVVTINYRLGPLGFLALPSVRQEDSTAGNLGLLDQVEALKWVKANIAAFGGNRNNVTIFGESAGGMSVLSLLQSPRVRGQGLVHKVIAQSAPYLAAFPNVNDLNGATEAFAARLGCGWQASGGTAAAQATCMRSRSVRDLAAHSESSLIIFKETGPLTFAPSVDGVVLTQNPLDAFKSGSFERVPVMVGTTKNEARLFAAIYEYARGVPDPASGIYSGGYAMTEEDYSSALYNMFGLGAIAVQAMPDYWSIAHGGRPDMALSALLTDTVFSCANQLLRNDLASRVPVYGFQFSDGNTPLSAFDPYRPSVANPSYVDPAGPSYSIPQGSYHSAELIYLFNRKNTARPLEPQLPMSASQLQMSERMIQYWGNFARTGNPNGSGLPSWDRYENNLLFNRHEYLELDPANTRTRDGIVFEGDHNCGRWGLSLPLGRLLYL
jgi:para-nitrobenzyl esterase